MTEKPRSAADYPSEGAALVRSTCLYVATKLGDLMDDLVVVGGLVPSLIASQDGDEAHVGTMDLDVGMSLALLSEGGYARLAERLRAAKFEPDRKGGRLTRQRWRLREAAGATVDFLIPPSGANDRGGRLRSLDKDFAAIIAPALPLAFRDRVRVAIDGSTPFGERARREVWVCGPGAFVVLKALAFDARGENKDAYDLSFVARAFGAGVDDVAARLRDLCDDADALRACEILRRDFRDADAVGPMRVAEFLGARSDRELRQDVVGTVLALLRRVGDG